MKRHNLLWKILIPVISVLSASMVMAQTAPSPVVYSPANAALYPAGIGFNPVVDYTLPQFAYSPNIRKFVDSLPGLGVANANNLGQYIPVANPDTTTFPGADYYEIGVKQFTKQMNTDLPATQLRGYYQINTGTTGTTDHSQQYLGAAVIAHRDRPVRVKVFNQLGTGGLSTGLGGNLPMPVDTTIMGAGMGPVAGQNYTQNRITVHLHGGNTPWISDGTPHQWFTPAADPDTKGTATYEKGASFQNVPDMVNGSVVNGTAVPCIGGATCFTPAAGDGIGTYYYTNQQSARLMFYHDHAYGITRLNVYAGLAAPYILTDQVEEDLLVGTNVSGGNPANIQILPDMGGVYHWGIPLVIQDKTFVNESATAPAGAAGGFPDPMTGHAPTFTTKATDPLWYYYATPTTTTVAAGNFWIGHEYLPIENIYDPTGNTWNGRWDYAPFLNPPAIPTNLTLPSPTIIPEAFQDTAVVNGTAFPYVTLPPDAYRFRILNACNDRSLNLQMYKADQIRINVTNVGAGYTNPTVTLTGNSGTYTTATAVVSPGTISGFNITGAAHFITPPTVTLTGGGGTCSSVTAYLLSNSSGLININAQGCTGYTSAPTVTLSGGGGGTVTSVTANVIPVGAITAVTVTGATGYRADQAAPTVNITGTNTTPATAVAFVGTEVKMVPASPMAAYPTWPTDGRDGGAPDPTTAAPPFIQIGNETGFMAQAAVWPQQPLVYEQSRQNIPTLGVTYRTLLLMPAMRADVIIDLSGYKDGDTLILYNDGGAPMPGFWPLNDFYTDDPDLTGVGAAPSTPAGFGPNTRTLMQIRIKGTKTSAFTFNQNNLINALPAAFAVAQDKPLVPQMAYNAAFPGFATFDTYAQNYMDTLNLTGTAQPISRVLAVGTGNGYTTPPTVHIVGGGMITPAVVTAGLNPQGGLTLLTAGAGYTTAPVVTIGTPASTYTAPAVPLAGIPQITATAVATISAGTVTALTAAEPGSNYNTNAADLKAVPTCTIAPPPCVINGTTCVTATCSSFIAAAQTMGSISVTSGGSYTSQPYVYITGNGVGATAVALLNGSKVFTGKSLTEGSDPDYGRLDIRLGSTPNALTPTVGNGQVLGLARYIDPPTEFLNDGEVILWRITHLGVDSHAMHFHLFNLQVVNHVDYTNVVKPPYPDEIGWREVIRTNPMEDIIVALQPRMFALPFPIPQSNRLLDPTNAVNVNTNFLPIAPPAGVPAVPQIINAVTNFGFEYVWHCHLLGHEENDMMRPMVLVAATAAPPAPALSITTPLTGAQITLTWTEASTFANSPGGFNLQRCSVAACVPVTMTAINNGLTRTYTDTAITPNTLYRYRLQAYNNVNPTAPVNSNTVQITSLSWATMVTPVNGSTLTGASQTFTWTNAGATQYQVWAGTTIGGSDIGFSPATAGTSGTINGLPTNGSKVYITLWSLSGGSWIPMHYTYTAYSAPQASMVSPVNGAVLAGATQVFTWTNAGASMYQVWAGSTIGGFDYGFSAQTAGTTGTITTLPLNGGTVYVRLWSLVGSTWLYKDYTYTASGAQTAAAITTPVPGTTLSGASQTISWTNTGANLYQVWVGSTVGASNYGFSPQTPTTSAIVGGFPANSTTAYVRLWSLFGSTWVFNDYTYTSGP
jgi:FtsP/CotA-like multicopper oxidase with cupredoxin domain